MSAVDARPGIRSAVLGGLLSLGLAWAAAAQPPAGVTDEKVAEGKALFLGEAKCALCHGKTAMGVAGMTSNLTDGEWKFAEHGSYEAIVGVIANGLSKEQTGGKVPMPSKDAKKLSDEQVQALAAYVWKLNQKGD